jgi:hypothetical protein
LSIDGTGFGLNGLEPIRLFSAQADAVSSTPLTQTSPLIFTFGGPVDEASLAGAAESIVIQQFKPLSIVLAQGFFAIEDDPTLPVGNRRRVLFQPSLETNAQGNFTGFVSGENYILDVRSLASGITIAGAPIANPTSLSFEICDPAALLAQGGAPSTVTPEACAGDIRPGAPFVAASVPDTNDPVIAMIDPTTERVSLFFNEAIQPNTLGISRGRRPIRTRNDGQRSVEGRASQSRPRPGRIERERSRGGV